MGSDLLGDTIHLCHILPGSLAVGEGHAVTSNLCYTSLTRSNYLECLKTRIVIEAYQESVSGDTKITFFTHQLAVVHVTTLVCDWLTIAKHNPHHFMVFRTSVHKWLEWTPRIEKLTLDFDLDFSCEQRSLFNQCSPEILKRLNKR